MEEGKQILHTECKMMKVQPNPCVNNDCPLLIDEKFDFDLSLSPASEQEDEVFVGPVGHKEKCIAVCVEAHEGTEDKIPPPPVDELTWSPLTGDKFIEIFKEAHLVALQIQSGSKTKINDSSRQEEQKSEFLEKYVQESKSKLKIFEKGIEMEKTPRAIKRETYCVWESPLCQLPPSLQKCSRQPIAVINSYSPQIPVDASSPLGMDKLSEPAIMPVAQKHSGENNKKTNKVQGIRASSVSGNSSYLAVDQTKQGKLSSPSIKNHLGSMGSSEDLLSDKSSIASDLGTLSLCKSSLVQYKRTLPTPSKLGRKATQLKLPSKVHMQRNTSSSSSSSLSSMNSSLNSCLSISPKGKVKTNVGPKASANSYRFFCGTSRISVVRPMSVSSVQDSQSDVSGQKLRSASATKGTPSANASKHKATLASETLGSGFQIENSVPSPWKSLQKNILGNVRASSKPQTKMASTLLTKEGMYSENTATRVLQPIGLLSCGNTGSNVAVSPPVKGSEDGIRSNSCSAIKSALRTPASVKHSALPTPVGRHISGIPAITPKTVPRSMGSSNFIPVRHSSSVSSKKILAASPKWAKKNKAQLISSSSSSTEGDFSPPQVVPLALNFSPEKPSTEMQQDLTEIQKSAEKMQVKEGLLIDIGVNKTPVAIQECENKRLINLFNTPEIIKVSPLKPAGLLIDLTSPLINLNHEGNKENLDSPLLKF